MKELTEKTLIPLSLVGIVIAGAIAWGSIRAEVSSQGERIERHAQAINQDRDRRQTMQNDLMAQILLLRQDVSEIKGEIKRFNK